MTAPGRDDLSQVHEPVLVQEVIAHLLPGGEAPLPGWVIDGTVGAGGHALTVLRHDARISLLGLDRDAEVLGIAGTRLESFASRVRLVHDSYANVGAHIGALDGPRLGVLLDLGLSSLQMDAPNRGFSFGAGEAVPDMRFDQDEDTPTALELVNHEDERTLADLIFELGGEPRARTVARRIVDARPIRDTAHLAQVVRSGALRMKRLDAATRTFQALRMAVNDELGHLVRGIAAAIDALSPSGRLVIICFHSGEERAVKQAFREAVREGRGRIITKKPIRPMDEETRRNPRARSARLRVFETLAEGEVAPVHKRNKYKS